MAFEPFGYRFEIFSSMGIADAKAAIRSGKMGWFAPREGPRGWIVGPAMCLWLSALDRQGPMVLAWVSSNGPGTRIVGRAGSDLNGIGMMAVLTPLLAFFALKIISEGASIRLMLILGAILLIGVPFTFWMAHKDRRKADPLVEFIRQTTDRWPTIARSRVEAH